MKFLPTQQNTLQTLLTVVCVGFLLLLLPFTAAAQFNPEINYQGKLTNASGVAVPDGLYNMNFWLVPTQGGATSTAVWSEARTSGNRVQVTNGLFSVMLGEVATLGSVDFNQTLYLGVEIGGISTTTPTWDGEMSPRKILGAVPAAFVAETASSADSLSGIASSSFLRSDEADTMQATSSSPILTLIQNGAGAVARFFSGVTEVFTILGNGNVGVGTSTPSARFTVSGDARITGTSTLATTSISSLSLGTALTAVNGGTGLNSVTQNQLLIGGAGNTWTQVATSSLGLGNGTFLGLTDTPSSYTANRIMFTNGGATALTDSANFTFDGTNLGLGTTTGIAFAGNRVISASTTAQNYMFGLLAGNNITTGGQNVLLGESAGRSITTGSNNTAVGGAALYGLTTGGYNNAIGFAAGFNLTGDSSYNSLFGEYAGNNLINSNNSIFFGHRAGEYVATTTDSVALGSYAARGVGNFEASRFTVLGFEAGRNMASGSNNNILLGYRAADNLTTGSSNIVIGYDIDVASTTASNRLNIGNLIFGTGLDGTGTTLASGNVGIGTSTPGSKLTVAGDLRLTGALRDGANASGTLGMVLQSTGTSTRWVATSTLGFGGASTFLGLTDTPSSFTANRIFYTNSGATAVVDNADFTYDGTNLGLGGDDGIAFGGTRVFTASTTAGNYTIGELAGGSITNGTNNILLGNLAGQSLTSGGANVFIGNQAGRYATTSDFNIAIGIGALSSTGGNGGNQAIGYSSGGNLVSGSGNNFLGYFAGNRLVTGSDNLFMGIQSGEFLATSSDSVALGAYTARGVSNYSASRFTVLGYEAGSSMTTGADNNILLGYRAANNLTSGANNIVIGYNVDVASTTASNRLNIGNLIFGTGLDGTGTTLASGNVGIGTSTPGSKLSVVGDIALSGNVELSQTSRINVAGERYIHAYTLNNTFGVNQFMGFQAGNFTSGSSTDAFLGIDNLGIGRVTLSSLTEGSNNTGVGHSALASLTTAYGNTAVGTRSMLLTTTGGDNNAFGNEALYSNTTGYRNTGIGNSVLYANQTGDSNVAVGYRSMFNNVVGSTNVGIGNETLYSGTTTYNNTAVGHFALRLATEGNNTGLGSYAGSDITLGSNNTILGHYTGLGITTGSNNTILGANVTGLSSSLSNNIIIADGQGNQRINVGASGNVGIGTTSPSAKLDVWGGLIVGTSSVPILYALPEFGIAGIRSTKFDDTLNIGNGGSSASDLASIGLYAPIDHDAGQSFGDSSKIFSVSSISQGGGYYQGGAVVRGMSADTSVTGLNLYGYQRNSGSVTTPTVMITGGKWNGASAATALSGTDLVLGIGTSTANANIASFMANGNVGIGTTTQASRLTVAGDFRLTGAFRDGSNASGTLGMVLQSTGTSTRWVATSTLGISGGASTFLSLTDTPSSYTANRIFYTNSGATAVVDSADFTYDGTNLGLGNGDGIAFGGTRMFTASTSGFISIGPNAGYNPEDTDFIAIGREAALNAAFSDRNVAIGYRAARDLGAGSNFNVFVGYLAGATSTGAYNNVIGAGAASQQTGDYNNVFGWNAGINNVGNYNNFIGYAAGSNQSGSNNNLIGLEAGAANTGSSSNLFGPYAGFSNDGDFVNLLGENAGRNNQGDYANFFGFEAGATSTGAYNNFFGYRTGADNTGSDNNALGYEAGRFNTGTNNNLLGSWAGYNNTGTYNNLFGVAAGEENSGGAVNALGYRAGQFNSSDDLNTFGYESGRFNQGTNNNFMGAFAGSQNDASFVNAFGLSAGSLNTGSSSNLFGPYAGYANTGDYVDAIGALAGYANVGNYNSFIGYSAGATTTGSYNLSLGYLAAASSSGSMNNIFGRAAGQLNSGSENNIFGYDAGRTNTGWNNNFFGTDAGNSNTGSNNNFFGLGAGYANGGSNNNFFGYDTGWHNNGNFNEMIGSEAGRNVQGSNSVLIGAQAFRGGAGFDAFSATNNVALGYRAGYNATTSADNNILIGYRAADNLTTGNNNIIIGYDIDNVTATADNRLNIGNLIFGTGLDGTGTTLASGNIGIGTTSPAAKLDVWGGFRVGTSSRSLISASTTVNQVAFGTNAMVTDVFGETPLVVLSGSGSTLRPTLYLNEESSDAFSSGRISFGRSSLGGDRVIGVLDFHNAAAVSVVTDIGDEYAGSLRFSTNAPGAGPSLMEHLRLTSGGNLGLGTTTPASKLTVVGDTYITGAFRDGSNASGTLGMVLQSTGTSTRWVATSTLGISGGSSLFTDGGATTYLTATGDNLAIGTTTSSARLTVDGDITVDGNINLQNDTVLTVAGERYIHGYTLNNTFGVNQFMGFQAGNFTSGSSTNAFLGIDNLGIGRTSLSALTEGSSNTAVGAGSMTNTTTGSNNTALGWYTLIDNISGSNNVALGSTALWRNTTGYQNIAVGAGSLENNLTGYENIAIGQSALLNSTSSIRNVAIGQQVMTANTAGGSNTAIGWQSMFSNTTGNQNAALGFASLYSNTTGYQNTALGLQALNANTTGGGNIGIGYQAGDNITTGNNNIVIGYDIDSASSTGSNRLNIGNLIFGTGLDGTGTTLSSGNIGIGTTSPSAKLDVWGNFQVGTSSSPLLLANTAAKQITIGTSTPATEYSNGATPLMALVNSHTTTNPTMLLLQETAANQFQSGVLQFEKAVNTGDSRVGRIVFANAGNIDAFTDVGDNVAGSLRFYTDAPGAGESLSERMRITSTGNVGIATTTPIARLGMERLNFATTTGAAGIDQYFSFSNSSNGATLSGNRTFLYATNTATTTIIGSITRVSDSTTFGNTVRGLEVQADNGNNTQGENTGIAAFGRTFGVRGTTVGDAGGTFEPAGIYGETEGTTQGNAIRGYSSSITTAALLKLFQDTSTFTGTGLLMNFGNAGGSFSSTTASRFIDLQNAGTSRFTVGAYGMTTIGDGTTNNNAGLQIGYGGLCVDNDGSCNASTTGRISAVSYYTANSDLAETYFSSEDLKTGEVVYLKGELSVGRASEATEEKIIGVVTTKPGLLLGSDDSSLRAGEDAFGIALAGRVPVRLSNENGEIKAGDELMLSSIPGVAMKASSTGVVVGIALEDFEETRAYSDTYINQFGDDIVDPVVTPINPTNDPRINDGCYYGAGSASGDAPCVPLQATTTDAQVVEAEALALAEAQAEALEALKDVPSEVVTLDNGETVRVGQVVMFVALDKRYLDEDGIAMVAALLASGEGADENATTDTIWNRLVTLANNFIDGVLSVLTLKADRVEVQNEICVDGVCLNAEDIRQLLDGNPAAPAPEETPEPEPVIEEEESEEENEGGELPPAEEIPNETGTSTEDGTETAPESTEPVIEETPEPEVSEENEEEETEMVEEVAEENEPAEESEASTSETVEEPTV